MKSNPSVSLMILALAFVLAVGFVAASTMAEGGKKVDITGKVEQGKIVADNGKEYMVADNAQSQELMSQLGGAFYQASWAGINFYVDANITDTSGTVSGGMFSRDAIALDIRRAFRIEAQRDASIGGGAIELNASMVYAYGVFRPTFGVLVKGASY